MIDNLLPNQNVLYTFAPVATSKKASGRGGWRPGSGRKAILKDPARITIDMERAGASYANMGFYPGQQQAIEKSTLDDVINRKTNTR